MKTFQATIQNKETGNRKVLSMDCADGNQARCFVQHQFKGSRIVSLREINWSQELHFDFVTVSHTTHVARQRRVRARRVAAS